MARNLRPKGVSSMAGRGDTPRLAAAVVAHPVDAVAPGAKRAELPFDPHIVGHPVLCETEVAVAASDQAAIDARPGQQLRRAHRIRLERRHGMKFELRLGSKLERARSDCRSTWWRWWWLWWLFDALS